MSNKIQTTELDFDAIKQSLKTYLSGQSEFSDYNFDGSGMNVLLDLLAYNTHYNGLYLNLALNESFLDTASKRASIVSKAKELGYVPRSSRSAKAIVTITYIDERVGAPAYYEIPAYSQFTTQNNEKTYVFYNIKPQIAYRDGNQYVFSNIEIYEGKLLEYSYEYALDKSFIIPNKDADISTLKVTVQDSVGSGNTVIFNSSNDIIDVDGDSTVYFFKENYDGLYEIEFGNGIIGKSLVEGNVINIAYIVCNNDEPNGARSFSYTGVGLPSGVVTFVTTTTIAHSGSTREDAESIRWNAPRLYTTQNRCVTASDYISVIKSMFSATAINVWGGQDNIPVQYGKVFISVVPTNKEFLDENDKAAILNIINPRKSLSIMPEFVEPRYLKINLDVSFYYNPNLTTRSSSELSALVLETIMDYKTNNLSSFDGIFKLSKLSADVDNCDKAITSNSISFNIHREVPPVFNLNTGYNVLVGNSIHKSVDPSEDVVSSGFYIPGTSDIHYIDDAPDQYSDTGKLRLFYKNANGEKVIVSDIGTIDYKNGFIMVNNLTIVGLYLTNFKFIINPKFSDVVSNRNQFVTIYENMVNITPLMDNR